MPTFEAFMHVTYEEIWTVEAVDSDEASKKFANPDSDVDKYCSDFIGKIVNSSRIGVVKKIDDEPSKEELLARFED